MSPKYSFIIPHINEGYFLNIMLDSMYNHISYEDYEIIIVDDGSNQLEDLDFIRSHFLKDKINLYYLNQIGLAGVKNFGAQIANGEFFIFIDAHMYFTDDFLTQLDTLLKQYNSIDILQPIIGSIADKSVQGKIYTIKNNTLDSAWDYPRKKNESGIYKTSNIAGGATVIKSTTFSEVGGFHPFFQKWGAEDLEFSMRAWLLGKELHFCDALFVAHYFKASFTNTVIKNEQVLNNKIMFALLCFSGEMQSRILNALQQYYGEDLYMSTYGNILNNKEFLNWNNQKKQTFIYQDNDYLKAFQEYIKLN